MHAAGIIIAPEKISDISPLVYEDNEAIVAFDKNDCEKIGLLKMDILSTAVLDKLMAVNSILKYGKIIPLNERIKQ
jgi:DNA polymerase III alpha subunit